MSRHFSAILLLDRVVPLDIKGIARAVEQQFPEIGEIEAVAGHYGQGESGLLRIEGAHVVLTLTAQPLPREEVDPPLKVLRSWNPEAALSHQKAYLTVSCGGGLEGLEGAEAYAAVVHVVTAAAASLMPGLGVLWQRGFALTDAVDFYESAKTLMAGHMPLGAWVSFASIVPRGYSPKQALGMVTYGLRPFIGREVELAPRPCDARTAYDSLSSVARDVLDRGTLLADGQRLMTGGATGFQVTVRARNYWLRRDQSAFVLVSDDSVVSAKTLRVRERPAA